LTRSRHLRSRSFTSADRCGLHPNSCEKPLTLCGRFRQDLWYRLNVFPITILPLRQRPDDIPLLLNHFIEKHCRKLGKPILEISKATMKALQARDWPGNIRELENVVERAVISSRGSRFEISDDSQIANSGPCRDR
jgi:DNA-binding NtrC family response regulator